MTDPEARRLPWTFGRRLVCLTVLLGALPLLSLLAASPVSAHALPVASVPAPGAVLQQPPTSVVMWFNEAPDPTLPYIQVLDTSGRHHEVGHAASSPGAPRVLSVEVRDMARPPIPKLVPVVPFQLPLGDRSVPPGEIGSGVLIARWGA